jgi:predicted transcriptional regulator
MNSGDNETDGIAERIRVAMLLRHVSAPEIARLLGRDVKTVRRHLRGETPWPMPEVHTIARHLHVPVNDIVRK